MKYLTDKKHILHRYHYFDGKRNTIEEHIKVIQKNGSVWWGLIGKAISIERTKEIANQLDNNIKTKVLLTTLDNLGNRIFYEATLDEIITDEADCIPDEVELIPEYYRDEEHTTWFKFSNIKKVDESMLDKYGLQSNPNRDLKISLKGQSSIMYIVEK